MMQNLNRIIAVLLVAAALLLGLFAWMLARRPPPARPVAPVAQASFPVVVATRALPAGKPIAVDALRVEKLPINPIGAFNDPALLAGRVPVTDIGAQVPVLDTQLSSGLAERVEPGERAVAVRVDESNAVGNRLRPGNFVDVFFTLKRDGAVGSNAEVERTQARLLLSRVRVIAFGKGDGAPGGGETDAAARTAVLAVPIAEVDSLTLAEGAGRLVLALRNPRDAEVADMAALPASEGVLKTAAKSTARASGSTRAATGISLEELSGDAVARAPVPAAHNSPKTPARVIAGAGTHHDIEVIRGGRAETVAW
ncbi:Flp pilus assembly protein CpaB [Paraburkholderia solisilvae]|uniref:Flp pilus assembly protein CpaB n=1 Tax=Paraburkholderia solisilvae TaxID=624376 RepID=UPI001583D5BD|nr:Flp pilus assembly protein CpaB [Paraburkholderia solisilvae]